MIQKQTKSRGFTIVELLIVIIVIAILAAITIVAYNGVQTRAHTTAQKTSAENLAKKVEAYNAVTGAYPVFNTAGTITSQLATVTDSSLTGSGITISYTAPAAGMADGTLQVRLCGATAPTTGTTATGYQVWGWDGTLSTPAAAMFQSGGTTTACSTSTSGS
jgi:prepilin-type N-terminal cleavage/methylation domain-containing protein